MNGWFYCLFYLVFGNMSAALLAGRHRRRGTSEAEHTCLPHPRDQWLFHKYFVQVACGTEVCSIGLSNVRKIASVML